MDYQFKKDLYGKPIATFSMGHESIGRWLTEELGCNQRSCDELLKNIALVEQGEVGFREIVGSEFELSISKSGVEVRSIINDFALEDVLLEDAILYQGESCSECGLTDFKDVLIAWVDYIGV